MDIYATLNSNCAALLADSQLQANAQIWYGRAMSVFIDQDRDNPPGDDAAPSIQLHSWFKRAGEADKRVSCGYNLVIAVADEDDVTRADDGNEFSGTQRLGWIIERALAVIRADKPAGWVMSFDYETDTISFFPAMLAGVSVLFDLDVLVGQDPLA